MFIISSNAPRVPELASRDMTVISSVASNASAEPLSIMAPANNRLASFFIFLVLHMFLFTFLATVAVYRP